MENNAEYFSRRAAEEQAAATSASDSRARRVHQEMAERYAQASETPQIRSCVDEPVEPSEVPVRNITIMPGAHQ